MLFHIQTKERDEPRPRAGVLRTREFTMKDAYSFDRDIDGLERSYELQSGAYERILNRCGLRWYRVECRCRDDGRPRRPRVHGSLRGRRGCGGAGAWVRRQREVTELRAGDPGPSGGTVVVESAIEVGNIFKLGTRYSEPLGATFARRGGGGATDSYGQLRASARRGFIAAAIEQGADESGIVWPEQSRPGRYELVSLGQVRGARAARRAEPSSTGSCLPPAVPRSSTTTGKPGAGEKLTDAELLGCPLRVVVGRRGLAEGLVRGE